MNEYYVNILDSTVGEAINKGGIVKKSKSFQPNPIQIIPSNNYPAVP